MICCWVKLDMMPVRKERIPVRGLKLSPWALIPVLLTVFVRKERIPVRGLKQTEVQPMFRSTFCDWSEKNESP